MTEIAKYGFVFIRERELPEIDATLYELEHKKSGARLIYLDRDDENKTFAIGFATPPRDDTGVFHIIEHSVLCGSKKYPLRDPFAELLKGSLNTFLNAITYEDRTIYPVSSRCEKDFLNLVDVYMDAVLRPNMLDNRSIFRQEGWHYEYDKETGALSINGVVYNEMKGAYSSPDEIGGITLNRALFDGSSYRYDSGGDPSSIPSLTYEDFKAAHEKYYHPSGAKIFLDGKMELSKVLPLLDSHLDRYEKHKQESVDCHIDPKIADTVTISYEISENESEHCKARVLYGFVYSDFADKEAQLTASILSDLLCGSNASPLKKALLERGLAKDAAMYSVKSMAQTVVIEIRDADEARLCEIDETVREVISGLITDGIDKSRLCSALNSIEFRLRERDFGTLPTGIAFAMSVYGGWVHGGLPEDALLIEKELLSVREKIDRDYFENELRKMTLDNPHRAKVIMLADKSLGERNAEEERARLDHILKGMSEKELEGVIEEEHALRAWQETDEGEDAKASLPTLDLGDIPKESDRPFARVYEVKGVKVVESNVKTKGIIYLSLHFDASDLAAEELIGLSMLASALINCPTEKRDALSLQNDIKANLGSLFTSFAVGQKEGEVTPYLKLGASALTAKSEDMIRLIREVLLTSKIEDETEILRLVNQAKSQIEDGIIASGESLALSRIEASVSEMGAVTEYLSGYEAYKILAKIASDREEARTLTRTCSALLKRLADRRRLTVSVTGDIPEGFVERIIEIFPEGNGNAEKRSTSPCADKSEFIIIPSKVAYAVLGGRCDEVGENLGIMRVARSILSYEYLWNSIRVKNGAYGAGFVPRRDGSLAFYSYRDPAPWRSVEYYKQSAEYLRAIAREGVDITKFIIGAVGEYDFIITPKTAHMVATRDYLNGYTAEDEKNIRSSMLNMTAEDLMRAADIIDLVLSEPSLAVVGGEEHLKSFAEPPKKIIKI